MNLAVNVQRASACRACRGRLSARLLDLGAQPIVNTPDEFAAQIRREVTKWQSVVAATGVKVE